MEKLVNEWINTWQESGLKKPDNLILELQYLFLEFKVLR